MGAVALDASVVIALLSPEDAHHTSAVSELYGRAQRRDAFLLVATAYAEVLVGPLREGKGGVVDDFVGGNGVEIVSVERSLAARAADLRSRHRALRLADALVLATALDRHAELVTFDERLSRIAAKELP